MATEIGYLRPQSIVVKNAFHKENSLFELFRQIPILESSVHDIEEDMAKRDLRTTPKISVKIWRPIIEKLDESLEAACLRRDAYLARVLEVELDWLDEEVCLPNSEASYEYVLGQLDRLDRKLVSLALPPQLTLRLNEICARKRVVRDAFFNRLFLLLSASPKQIDALYFGGSGQWRKDVWMEHKVDGPFFHNGFYPLSPTINPFWALRAAHDLQVSASDVEDSDYAALEHFVEPISGKAVEVVRGPTGEVEPQSSIYTKRFPQNFNGNDLIGLSCYLPDWEIPGSTAERDFKSELDRILGVL